MLYTVVAKPTNVQWCGLRPSVLGQDWSETNKIARSIITCGVEFKHVEFIGNYHTNSVTRKHTKLYVLVHGWSKYRVYY